MYEAVQLEHKKLQTQLERNVSNIKSLKRKQF